MLAERETADRLIAQFLADRIGADFKGRISGVTKSGLFVRLDDTGADGFIPISTLGREYFRFDETVHALIGERSGAAYRLGDRCDVRLVEAIPTAGALRFEMLSEGADGDHRQGAQAGAAARPPAAAGAAPTATPLTRSAVWTERIRTVWRPVALTGGDKGTIRGR